MVKRITLEEEFKKNPEMQVDDFNNLKDWYSWQAHLPPLPDQLLVLFYHSCYFKMEATKTVLDTYFTFRTHTPEFFSQRDPFTTNMKDGKPVVLLFMLPQCSPDGYRIKVARLGNTDPNACVVSETIKAFLMVSDLDLNIRGTAPGFVIIIDMEGIKFGHVAKLNVLTVKKLLFYLQEAMPVRLKGLHFVNVVPLLDIVMNMMRPFLKKEITEVLHVHGEGIKSLYSFLPTEILPTEYGGKEASCMKLCSESLKLSREYSEWFEDESKLRVVELRRPGRAKSAGHIFNVEGIVGSFKRLNFD